MILALCHLNGEWRIGRVNMTSSSSKTLTNDLSVPVYYLRVKDPTVVYFKDNNSNNLLTLGYSIYSVLTSTSY